MTESQRTFRLDLGALVVTALHDGRLDSAAADYHHMSVKDMEARFVAAGQAWPPVTDLSLFLIETPGRRVMVDAGAGPHLSSTAGKALAALATLGLTPDDIDVVLMTHLHSDHVSGLLTAAGESAFPRAEVWIHWAEQAYWLGRGRQELTAAMAAQCDLAEAMLKPYAGRIRGFADGLLWERIEAVPLPGHTPGHCGFLLSGNKASVLIAGDFVHLPEIQVARPEVTTAYDVGPDLAEASRRGVLARSASEGIVLAGMHMRWPPFGRAVKDRGSFALSPIDMP